MNDLKGDHAVLEEYLTPGEYTVYLLLFVLACVCAVVFVGLLGVAVVGVAPVEGWCAATFVTWCGALGGVVGLLHRARRRRRQEALDGDGA